MEARDQGVAPEGSSLRRFATYARNSHFFAVMATKLDKPIRREIVIDGQPYTVVVAPDGLRLAKKRFRSGVALSWKAIWDRLGASNGVGHDGVSEEDAESA